MSSPDPNTPIDPGSHRTLDPAGTHDFANTVEAVLNDAPAVRDAVEGLTEAGFDFEILRGEPGRHVVSVEVEDDDATQAIAILRNRGGEYLWKLGTWTFTPVGD